MYRRKGGRTLQLTEYWTNDGLIELLVGLGKELGRTPTIKDLRTANDMPSTTTYMRFFGSWNNALEAAGFSPNVRHDWTKSELIELLVKLSEKLGKTPTKKDVGADKDMPSTDTYASYFGSWDKALEAAGLK